MFWYWSSIKNGYIIYNKSVILIKNINTFEGSIPVGYDLVEYEKGENPLLEGMMLYGFDEVESMGYKNPQHAFVKIDPMDMV